MASKEKVKGPASGASGPPILGAVVHVKPGDGLIMSNIMSNISYLIYLIYLICLISFIQFLVGLTQVVKRRRIDSAWWLVCHFSSFTFIYVHFLWLWRVVDGRSFSPSCQPMGIGRHPVAMGNHERKKDEKREVALPCWETPLERSLGSRQSRSLHNIIVMPLATEKRWTNPPNKPIYI